MIDGVTNAGSIPVLKKMAQFAGRRHTLLANNLANLSTPNYRAVDVSVEGFRTQLREAVDERRAERGNLGGDLPMRSTAQVSVSGDGTLQLHGQHVGSELMHQDGNDRNVEREMQQLVENTMMYRQMMEMLRSRFNLINTAIRERM